MTPHAKLIEQARKFYNGYGDNHTLDNISCEVLDLLQVLITQLEADEKALRFYANSGNVRIDPSEAICEQGGTDGKYDFDEFGTLAKQTLGE